MTSKFEYVILGPTVLDEHDSISEAIDSAKWLNKAHSQDGDLLEVIGSTIEDVKCYNQSVAFFFRCGNILMLSCDGGRVHARVSKEPISMSYREEKEIVVKYEETGSVVTTARSEELLVRCGSVLKRITPSGGSLFLYCSGHPILHFCQLRAMNESHETVNLLVWGDSD